MNRDINLINRALANAGQEPLTQEAMDENVTTWRTIKEFYLPLLLEMLSEAEWTYHKKRVRLVEAEIENLSDYAYLYKLPIDCSKPIEVQNNIEYIVEGDLLYTNVDNAILLYVSNNHRKVVNVLPEVTYEGEKVLFDGQVYIAEHGEWILWEVTEDYPEYDEIKLAPEEAKCFENILAAQIALKITGDMNTYQLLFGIAQGIKDKAIKQSRSQGVSKEKGNEYWGDKLGITVDGEYNI